MQFSKATLLAVLAAIVQAQTISDLVGQIPSCAVSCLTTAIQASGCALTDYVCQCTTGHNTILANGAGCISKACSTSDALTTTNVTNQICALATAGGASSTAASTSSSSSSATSPASSAVSSATSSAASAMPSSSMAAGTAASSAATMASSSVSSTASVASSSTPATATTNAGSGFKVGAGMMGAAVIAAIAL